MGPQGPDARRRGRGPAGHGLRAKWLHRARHQRGRLVGELADVDRLFRRESGRAVASLIRVLGDFDLAEDAVQDAFAVAIERWPRDGAPRNPGAWITRVARNAAIDRLRRERTYGQKLRDLEAMVPAGDADEIGERDPSFPDDRLRLIFTCCHPAIAPESRVALTLRTLGGLSTSEIARAFLSTEPAMAQRLVRTKRKIQATGIRYEVPSRERMPERLPSVLATVYLIFNEGYLGTSSETLLREELCADAIDLAGLLAATFPEEPEILGLLAMMELTHARRRARVDGEGELVLLGDQDRSLWIREEIDLGLAHAGRAASLVPDRSGPTGPYMIQASIAAEHARAPMAAATDWARIARLYSWLLIFDPSPVVELNRAVAVAEAEGPTAGLELVDAISGLGAYAPFHVTRASLLTRLDRAAEATAAYGRALELTDNPVQRASLERRRTEVLS